MIECICSSVALSLLAKPRLANKLLHIHLGHPLLILLSNLTMQITIATVMRRPRKPRRVLLHLRLLFVVSKHRDHGAPAYNVIDVIILRAEMRHLVEVGPVRLGEAVVQEESVPIGDHCEEVGAQRDLADCKLSRGALRREAVHGDLVSEMSDKKPYSNWLENGPHFRAYTQ